MARSSISFGVLPGETSRAQGTASKRRGASPSHSAVGYAVASLRGEAMATATPNAPTEDHEDVLDLTGLIPDLFEKYFAFFRPGHQEGVVPSRVKELARLKIAELNGCDT
jgi:hypothetical protein